MVFEIDEGDDAHGKDYHLVRLRDGRFAAALPEDRGNGVTVTTWQNAPAVFDTAEEARAAIFELREQSRKIYEPVMYPVPPWIYLDAPAPLSDISPWDGNLGTFTHYAGYSVLGHVILTAPATGEFGILYPLQEGGFKSYGLTALEPFRAAVLDEPGYRDYALPSRMLAAIRAAAGDLEPGQVYFPVPYPFIGGSGDPSTYKRGEYRVFLSIVGQMLGLESR